MGAVDPGCARWLESTAIFPERQWIVHVVQPPERLGAIAARYGVSREDLARWNELSGPRARVRPGKKLKIHTDRQPPPLERIVHTVAAGETWEDLAIRHRILVEELKIWNSRLMSRPLEAGATVKIWTDPGAPRTVYCRRGEPPPPIEHRKDAVSLGHPQSGRLKNGILLPNSPLWVRGRRDGNWASTHTLEIMIEAFTRLRVDDGYDGEIFVGGISRRRGGKFPPHKSHRTGLDIDIRLPLLPGIATETYPSPDVIDWPALWAMIEAFVETGEVSMIFLDRNHQKRLYQVARWYGWTPEELAPILHWPRKDKKHESIVRHARGHKGHIHVRLLCGPEEGRCAPGRARVLERRGWIEPEPSGKASREGAKARREQWKLEGRVIDEGEEDDVEVGD
ncbi:MAG: penicillin-insensitive murein endopeptidase [Nannocystaceae bacterium]